MNGLFTDKQGKTIVKSHSFKTFSHPKYVVMSPIRYILHLVYKYLVLRDIYKSLWQWQVKSCFCLTLLQQTKIRFLVG